MKVFRLSKAPFAYLAVGLLWILFSDWLVEAFVPSGAASQAASALKGVFYVVFTTVLLQFYIGKRIKAQRESEDILKNQQGCTFKIARRGEKFIYTMGGGHLLRALGLSENLFVNKTPDEVFPSEVAEEKRSLYGRALSGEEVWYEGELNGVCYLCALRPVAGADGAVLEAIGSCVDITERKKTEEHLRRSDKTALVAELAAGVAHEIRNPLASLKGFTQLLKMKAAEDHNYYEIMLSELDRIDFIAGELLALSRPQSLDFQLRDAKKIAQDAVFLFRAQASIKGVAIEFQSEEGAIFVSCQENQLKQALINLLKNAVEASGEGKTVRVSVKQDSGSALFAFEDEGEGITEERMKRLGEPFFTTKDQGAGIGLMVSMRIAESHKGKISFKSELGKGTAATLSIPSAR